MSTKKEQTRQRIIVAAGEGIRQRGYGGMGVDGIAKGAGVTSGAIYAHFGSKDKVFEASVMAGMQDFVDGVYFWRESKGDNWLTPFIQWYLSTERREDIIGGCALPGLTADVTRAGANVHSAYEKLLDTLVVAIAEGLPEKIAMQDRKNTALSLLSVLTGAVLMSRAVDDAKVASTIADAAKNAAIAMVSSL